MANLFRPSRAAVSNTPTEAEVLTQLDRILASQEFSASSRCTEFLRYVTGEVLAGRGSEIKERTIATDVFGKSASYNPNEDSLVRVKASEVRRRLSKYYERLGTDARLRVELHLGSYVPTFERMAVEEREPTQAEKPQILNRRSYLITALTGSAAMGGAVLWWQSAHRSMMERFWMPIHEHSEPLLIFLPILRSRDHAGQRSDRVGVGAASACVLLADRFSRSGQRYTLRVGDDLTFSDLRRQPAILLGNFLSYWTKDMNRDLRFVFDQNNGATHILDTKMGTKWYPVDETSDGYTALDYALVTRTFDAKTGQILIVASGLTTFGTQAAVDFLVNPTLFEQMSRLSPADWATRNLQVILSARVIGATPGPARVVSAYFW